jgi:hypothetical protein
VALHDQDYFSDERRKNLSLKLDDTMVSCGFNDVKCKPKDFVWHFSPGYGNCYSFNSGFNSLGEKVDPKKTFLTEKTKFKLQIYVNFHESLSQLNAYYGEGLGALVLFSNNSHLSSSKKKVYVPSGMRSVISIDRSFKFSLPKPYSNCDIDNNNLPPNLDSPLFNLIYHSKYEYSQDLCLNQCYLSENIKVCNCTDPSNEISVFDAHKCQTIEEISWG